MIESNAPTAPEAGNTQVAPTEAPTQAPTQAPTLDVAPGPRIVAIKPSRTLNIVLVASAHLPKASIDSIERPLRFKPMGVGRQAIYQVIENLGKLPLNVALVGSESDIGAWVLSSHEDAVSSAFDSVLAQLERDITPPSTVDADTTHIPDQALKMLTEELGLTADTAYRNGGSNQTVHITLRMNYRIRDVEELETVEKAARAIIKKADGMFDTVNLVWAFQPSALLSHVNVLTLAATNGSYQHNLCGDISSHGQYGPLSLDTVEDFQADWEPATIFAQHHYAKE